MSGNLFIGDIAVSTLNRNLNSIPKSAKNPTQIHTINKDHCFSSGKFVKITDIIIKKYMESIKLSAPNTQYLTKIPSIEHSYDIHSITNLLKSLYENSFLRQILDISMIVVNYVNIDISSHSEFYVTTPFDSGVTIEEILSNMVKKKVNDFMKNITSSMLSDRPEYIEIYRNWFSTQKVVLPVNFDLFIPILLQLFYMALAIVQNIIELDSTSLIEGIQDVKKLFTKIIEEFETSFFAKYKKYDDVWSDYSQTALDKIILPRSLGAIVKFFGSIESMVSKGEQVYWLRNLLKCDDNSSGHKYIHSIFTIAGLNSDILILFPKYSFSEKMPSIGSIINLEHYKYNMPNTSDIHSKYLNVVKSLNICETMYAQYSILSNKSTKMELEALKLEVQRLKLEIDTLLKENKKLKDQNQVEMFNFDVINQHGALSRVLTLLSSNSMPISPTTPTSPGSAGSFMGFYYTK